MTTPAARRATAGVVFPDALYRPDALRRALGWGRVSWRRARRDGLRVLRCGRSRYVKGADVVAYLEATGQVETVNREVGSE